MTVKETAQEIAREVNSEWWKRSSEEAFTEAAETLLHEGWSQHNIENFLSGLYAAVADEYGG